MCLPRASGIWHISNADYPSRISVAEGIVGDLRHNKAKEAQWKGERRQNLGRQNLGGGGGASKF